MGAHGEPGTRREQIRPVQDIVDDLVKKVGCVEWEDEQKVNEGDRIAVLLNSMGYVTNIEMGVIAALGNGSHSTISDCFCIAGQRRCRCFRFE